MKELVDKYNYFRDNFPFKKNFYHLKSIENFIKNFDKVTNKIDKEKVFNLLVNYLEYASNNEIETNKHCKKIFYEFIHPIGLLYKKNMNFILLVLPSTLIWITILINIALLLFKKNELYFVIGNLISIGVYLLIKKYMKKENVYCYNF